MWDNIPPVRVPYETTFAMPLVDGDPGDDPGTPPIKTNDHSKLTNLDFASSGHSGFANFGDVETIRVALDDHKVDPEAHADIVAALNEAIELGDAANANALSEHNIDATAHANIVATINTSIQAEATTRAAADTGLSGDIANTNDALSTAKNVLTQQITTGDTTLNTRITDEVATLNGEISDLSAKLSSQGGLGGYIKHNDFGTATPAQADITAYVKSQIWPGDESSHPDTDIFHGTRVTNDYDNTIWVLSNTPDTTPPVFEWEAAGNFAVSIATTSAAGIVMASEDQYAINVDANGKMTINDVEDLIGGGEVTPVPDATTTTKGIATLGATGGAARYGQKADVALANVDNTSDANKPISTAQAAINAQKQNVSSYNNYLNDGLVASNLRWSLYKGGINVIRDISDGKSLNGSDVSNTDAVAPWRAGWPTLAGIAGDYTTCGVRVDSARRADSAASADYAESATDPNAVRTLSSTSGALRVSKNGTNVDVSTNVPDTRYDNQSPLWYMGAGTGVYTEFKYASSIGLNATSTFVTVETTVGWVDTSGMSGGPPIQKATDGNGYVYVRSGMNLNVEPLWGPWIRMATIMDIPSIPDTSAFVMKASNPVIIGSNAASTIASAISIGADVRSTGSSSIAIGSRANAIGAGIAIGYAANVGTAANTQAIAVGYSASAKAGYSTSMGYVSNASGLRSISIGPQSQASMQYSIALGNTAYAFGDSSIAIGYAASTSSTDSSVIQLGSSQSISALRCRVALTVTSDERDKTDIVALDKSLEFLNAIKVVQFVHNHRELYFIPEEDRTEEEQKMYETYGMTTYNRVAHEQGTKKGQRKRVGVIAQQVQQAMADIYGTYNYADIINDNLFDISDAPPNVEHQLTANYQAFIPFLIQAIQQLDARVKVLEAKYESG